MSLIAFLGLGSAGTFGVYSWGEPFPPVRPIADLTTAIPAAAARL